MQGQLSPEEIADPSNAIASVKSDNPVRLAFPERAPDALKKPGTLASAAVLTDPGNPINVLAKILRWLSTWASYVFRCQPKQVTEHRE